MLGSMVILLLLALVGIECPPLLRDCDVESRYTVLNCLNVLPVHHNLGRCATICATIQTKKPANSLFAGFIAWRRGESNCWIEFLMLSPHTLQIR